MFFHPTEKQEALRIVGLIAADRNPFSEEPFEHLRPHQRDSVLKALCLLTMASMGEPVAAIASPTAPASAVTSTTPGDSAARRPLPQYLDRVEREAIVTALEETHYNRTAAAALLGITLRALRYRMERLEIDVGDLPPDAE